MAGKTGYPAYTNSNAPTGPAQMDALGAHFDALVDESVATASALPASGNWPRRTIIADDTKITYRYDGSAWHPWSMPRTAVSAIATSGITLGTGGTSAGFVSISGGRACLSGVVTLGTGAAVSSPEIVIPAVVGTAQFGSLDPVPGAAIFIDTSAGSTGRYAAGAYALTATLIRLVIIGSNGNLAVAATLPSGAAWASGDQIKYDLDFPVA